MADSPTTPISLGEYQGEVCAQYATPAVLQWLQGLETRLESGDARLIYRVRNRIFQLEFPHEPAWEGVCIKHFAPPSLVRAFRYARSGGKGARSFRHAMHLHRHGVGVPAPLGFYEKREGARLTGSCYLSAYVGGATDFNAEMNRLLRHEPDYNAFRALIRVVATEVRKMHACGFLHNDLAGHNILLSRTAAGALERVSFIDINRGRIRERLSLRLRARDIARLQLPSYLRREFFHIYFGDAPVPRAFVRWESAYRTRTTLHNKSRKFRHPIRHLIHSRRHISNFTQLPEYRDMWLWDSKSGQPGIMLASRDRLFKRTWSDVFPLAAANLRHFPSFWRRYRAMLKEPHSPRAMTCAAGLMLEFDEDPAHTEEQFRRLEALPGIPVMLRVYFHMGEAALEAAAGRVARLAALGHEVSINFVQSRAAVLDSDQWAAFVDRALQLLHPWVRFVEIGHAVNRVKWGIWDYADVFGLWRDAGRWRTLYPGITFLGPALNDFEYHILPPLMAELRDRIDGLSCHLYVDRCGAPENFQGKFSTFEKCVLGRAIAAEFGASGFYITETNWPLASTGEYSPVHGHYILPGTPDNHLHVDEASYAAYMVRYFLIALCRASSERVWLWRLTGHGFGLIDNIDGFRARPGWSALTTFHRELGTARFLRHATDGAAQLYHFDRATVAYAPEPLEWTPLAAYARAIDLHGNPVALPRPGEPIRLSGDPVYLFE